MSDLIDVTDNPLAGKFVIESDGRWFHDGEEITHVRTWQYFSRTIKCDPDGTVYLTDGKVRINIEVKDAPLLVTAIRIEPAGVRLRLHDETYVTLDPATIRFLGGAPYCTAREGLAAKFTTTAWMQLSDLIEESPDGFVLVLNGKKYPVSQK